MKSLYHESQAKRENQGVLHIKAEKGTFQFSLPKNPLHWPVAMIGHQTLGTCHWHVLSLSFGYPKASKQLLIPSEISCVLVYSICNTRQGVMEEVRNL